MGVAYEAGSQLTLTDHMFANQATSLDCFSKGNGLRYSRLALFTIHRPGLRRQNQKFITSYFQNKTPNQ